MIAAGRNDTFLSRVDVQNVGYEIIGVGIAKELVEMSLKGIFDLGESLSACLNNPILDLMYKDRVDEDI